MNFRHITTILATTALVGIGGISIAQDKTGENVTKGGEATEGAVGDLTTAQNLYAWGVAHDSAVAVAAAAEIMASIDLKDVDREVEVKQIDGAAVSDGGDTTDSPVDLDTMVAKAKELAAGDEQMLAMIDDITAGSSRGRIGGASKTLSRLSAGYYDTWKIPYYGGELAELGIAGDGDSDLDLLVTDENGNTICYDTSYSDRLYCSWTPAWDGYFIVIVKNMGSLRNSYWLLTN